MPSTNYSVGSIAVGTSFKPQHAADIAKHSDPVSWFEVHPENYMVEGGPRLAQLTALRAEYPVSLHGVGMSLGSGQLPDKDHLSALAKLVDHFDPVLVSEHLAWSSWNDLYLPDLLPAELTLTLLNSVIDAVDQVQQALGRKILLENPSSYLPQPDSWLPEVQFLVELAQRSGCGLLIDVNNIHVSAFNLGFDAKAYIDAIPVELVGEIHLAGHDFDANTEDPILIDTHGCAVADEVWALYDYLLMRTGARPTLVEWDTNLPDWSELKQQAEIAHAHLDSAVLTAACA